MRLILERAQQEEGLEPRVRVQLPEDKRVRDLAVRPPSPAGYGALADEDEAAAATSADEEDRDEAL